MKIGIIVLVAIIAFIITWKIVKFIIFPFLIPIALIGLGYLAFKKGWFKKLF